MVKWEGVEGVDGVIGIEILRLFEEYRPEEETRISDTFTSLCSEEGPKLEASV